MVGANTNPEVISSEESSGYFNYYLPQCPKGVTNVKSYKRLTILNVYPNIDWILYVDSKIENGFKYEFIIHPGGNYRDIQMEYLNFDKLDLTKNGDLILTNPIAELTDSKPVSYLEQWPEIVVKSQFMKTDNVISFDIDNYDKSKTLVIDPSIVWSSYFAHFDLLETTNDYYGNMYATADIWFSVPTLPLLNAIQDTVMGDGDIYLAKLDSTGNLLWQHFLVDLGKSFSHR
ncbi:MAG: hypothetical protein JKY53_10715 [Flavobacteriales bacterium]|nr:hypothetical protein [Flavobacteriales bacterium]